MILEKYVVFWNTSITLLFSFFLISLMLFIKVKKRVYLYYSLYLFFLVLYILPRDPYSFFSKTFFYSSFFKVVNWYLQVIYHFFYFIFGVEFLSVKTYSKRFYRQVKQVLLGLLLSGSLVALFSFYFQSPNFMLQYYTYAHLPFILIFSVYFLYTIRAYKNSVYNFFLIAYVFYALFSLIAFFFSIFQPDVVKTPIIYFYIGIMLETIVLSYGIGYQGELIYKENIAYERKLRIAEESLKKQMIQKNEILNQKHLNQKLKTKQLALKNELSHLKIVSLKNQMNSHFIFNTLNSIKSYITQKTPAEAVVFVTKFSKFIRFILEYSDKEVSSLKRELTMIELYKTLENMRFEKAIKFKLIVDKNINTEEIKVPSMIFQPFVENAIWHGLLPKKDDKKLQIEIKKHNKSITVSIEDNGVGRNAKSFVPKNIKKTSKGLLIINQKLNHFNQQYNTNISYKIIDLPQGTKVVVKIDPPSKINKS